MPSELGELLTRWTVRVAVACYVGRLAVDLAAPPSAGRARLARGLWTAGCAIYLVHVACAFAYFHEWSHDVAYAYTVARTGEVTGWRWGGGLYVNYLFTLLWAGDVIAWWLRSEPVRRLTPLACVVHGVFAFLMFNATVVFGPPFWRWAGAATVFGLGWLALRRLKSGGREFA